MDLKDYIRDVPNFPAPGIVFRDITPLLADPGAFNYAIAKLAERYRGQRIDAVVAVESRGFLVGAPLARELGTPLVPVRKPGKLPAETYSTEYTLEYGSNTMEMHVDGVSPGQRTLVVDDLLATGGTLAATVRLVEAAGGVVSGVAVVIELTGLEGRRHLEGYELFSLIQY
jgi:adenine phosphoribosyltransferase